MSTGGQTGPGYVMTTHGPVRRSEPPWDYPAGPDHPGAPEAAEESRRGEA